MGRGFDQHIPWRMQSMSDKIKDQERDKQLKDR